MMTAILAGLVLFALFFGRLPLPVLGALCLSAALGLWRAADHEHGDVLVIDRLARHSRLREVHTGLKCALCAILLALSISAETPWVSLCMAAVLAGVTVVWGGVSLRRYVHLLAIPAVFLLLSALALLAGFSSRPDGVLSIPFPGGYLVVTSIAQTRAGRVLAHALGGVACLYALALSTPVSVFIPFLRRLHVPAVMTDLAVLIYRYVFLLLCLHAQMRQAASSRMGYAGIRRSVHTTGLVYGGLLARSFRRAGACFDAMESRCYGGEIRFLTQEKPLCRRDVLAGGAGTLLLLILWLAGKGAV